MAKVKELKFNISGIDYVVNINCNSIGLFSANLPEPVYKSLGLNKSITAQTLTILENDFKSAIDRYKNAETKQELLILIKYGASGSFSYKKDKSLGVLFGDCSKYNIHSSFNQFNDIISFDFLVVIKETVDTKESFYKAKLGSNFAYFQDESKEPDKWHKQERVHRLDYYKQIPFTEIAYNSLLNARGKLRDLSEMLFNFIEQDEQDILLALNNQKLLN